MDSQIIQNPWTSLEIAKLLVSTSVPILVVIFAFQFNKAIKKLDKLQWTNQKVIEKRIEVYDIIVPKLNDLLCYYCYIGNWKEITPKELIEIKRVLDKKMNVYAPLFSSEVLENYNLLIDMCFEKFTGWGNDAKINSLFERRKECDPKWQKIWEECFSSSFIKKHKDKDDLVRRHNE